MPQPHKGPPVSKKKQRILDYLKNNPNGAPKPTNNNANAKNKKKAASKQNTNTPSNSKKRAYEEEVELSDEDMDLIDKYGSSASFLDDLDASAIKKITTKHTAKKLKRSDKASTESVEDEGEGGEDEDLESRPRVADWDDGPQVVVREKLPFKTQDGQTIPRSVITPLPREREKLTSKDKGDKKGAIQPTVADEKETSKETTKTKDKREKEKDKANKEAPQLEEPVDEMSELRKFQATQDTIEQKKDEIALYSDSIVVSPETNIDKLQKLFMFCHDPELPSVIHNIALLSIAAVFKDIQLHFTMLIFDLIAHILPGYKIVLQSLEDVKLSKEKKRIHDYESQLLSTYQDFLGLLTKKSKDGGPGVRRLVAKAVSALLTTHPHFNFRTELINIIVPLAGKLKSSGKTATDSSPETIALKGIQDLFESDITSGQATLETVRRIATYGKQREYRINPDLLRTFTKLKLSEDVGEINPFAAPPKDNEDVPITAKEKLREKKQFINKKERKRLKKEREIDQQLMTASGAVNKTLVMKTQREVLRSVFSTYFRVIKKAPQSVVLPAVLQGLAQYSHLISVDFLSDLINALLQVCADEQKDQPYNQIQCCLAVFKTMKAHGEALNVDLKEFYEILYSVLPYIVFSHEHECNLPLVTVLGVMIASDRKAVALERIAAFAKRISTLALHTLPHLSHSLLYIVRLLLVKFPKLQQLLTSEYTYSAGTYNAMIDQPDHCGPFATSLWDLNLLGAHFHPSLAKEAASISNDDPSNFSPKPGMVEYLFHAYDPSYGGFNPPIPPPRKHRFEKKKNDKKKLFVRQTSQYPPSSFAAGLNTRFLESQTTLPASFTKYFNDLRKFDTKKELFRLKRILARYKTHKSKKVQQKK